VKGAVLYEASATVRDAWNAAGHDFVSVDLRERAGDPLHIVMDALAFLRQPGASELDLVIAHPPCTYLSVSGQHWNQRNHGRAACTLYALDHVRKLFAELDRLAEDRRINVMNGGAPKLRRFAYCVENPVSIIATEIRPCTQIIQPYEHGHDASKQTMLWLLDLPPLRPTKRVRGRIVEIAGKRFERFANQTDSGQNALPPSEDRWSIRSETYDGIAAAMVEQWQHEAGAALLLL